jgi:hypothetical protein
MEIVEKRGLVADGWFVSVTTIPLVGTIRQFERISYGLGQRYHYFDEISLLFETTLHSFRPRYVVLAIAELSRTINEISSIMITLSKPCGHLRQLYAPKRRFWIAERTFGTHFQSTFQRVSTRFGLRSFEITSKMRSQMFVRTSKLFVWGA